MSYDPLQNLYEFYNDTLADCGLFLLDATDVDIEYHVFENFIIGVVSALYPPGLKELYDGGLISLEKMEKSISLRNMVLALDNTEEWTILRIRTSDKWKTVMQLCDEIKKME